MDHATSSHNHQVHARSSHLTLSNEAALVQQAFTVLQNPSSNPAESTNANRFLEQFQSSTASNSSSLRACFELLENDSVQVDTKIFAATQLKRGIQAMPGSKNNLDFSIQVEQLKNGVIGVVRQLPYYATTVNNLNNPQQRVKQLSSLRRQLCICLADVCLLSEQQCLTYLDELVQSFATSDYKNNLSSLILIDCFTMLLEELDNEKFQVPAQSRNNLLSVTSRILDILDSLAASVPILTNDDAENEKVLIALLKCFDKWIGDAGNAGILYKDRIANSTVYRIALQCMQNPAILTTAATKGFSLAIITATVDVLSTISNLFMDTHGVQSEQLIAKQYQQEILHLQPIFDRLLNFVRLGAPVNERDIHDYTTCYVRVFIDATSGVVDELVDNYSADGSTSLGNAQLLPIVLKCMHHVPSSRHWVEFLYQLSEQLNESMLADIISEPQMTLWCEWYVRFVDVLVDDVSIDAEALNGDVSHALLQIPNAEDKKDDDDDNFDDDQGIEDDDANSKRKRTAKTATGVLVDDIIDLRYEIADLMKCFSDAMPTHTLAERILFHKMQMNNWLSVEACLYVAAPLMPNLRRKYVLPAYAQIIDACISLHYEDESSANASHPMQLRLTAVRFLGRCAKLFTYRDSNPPPPPPSNSVEVIQIFTDERFGRLITSLLNALRRSPAKLGCAVCWSLLKYSEACPVEFARFRRECAQFVLPVAPSNNPQADFVLPLRSVSLLTEAVIRAVNSLLSIVERLEFVEYVTSSAAQSLVAVYELYQQRQHAIFDTEKRRVRHALDVIAVCIKEWSWKISSSAAAAPGRNFDHSLSAPSEHSTDRVHAGDVHSAAQLLLLGTPGASAEIGASAHAHVQQSVGGQRRRMQTPPSTPIPPLTTAESELSPQQQLARLKQSRYAPLIERLMQTVANTCIQFIERESIVEKCVRCMRHMLRSLGQEAAPLVPELMRLIVQLYAAKKYSCFLYLASIVIDEFGVYESCQSALLQLTHQLCTMTSCDSFGLNAVFGTSTNIDIMPSAFDVASSDPAIRAAFSERVDIIEDYFCLCQRWIQRCGSVFAGINSGGGGDAESKQNESVADHLLQQMMMCAMLALLYQTQEKPLARVCDFLTEVGTLLERHTNRVAAKFDERGFPPQLLATVLIACVNNNRLDSNLVEDLAGLLYTMRSVYKDERFCGVFLRQYAVEQVRVQCGSLPGDEKAGANAGQSSSRINGGDAIDDDNELKSLDAFCVEIERAKDHARQMYNAAKNLMRAYKAMRRRTAQRVK